MPFNIRSCVPLWIAISLCPFSLFPAVVPITVNIPNDHGIFTSTTNCDIRGALNFTNTGTDDYSITFDPSVGSQISLTAMLPIIRLNSATGSVQIDGNINGNRLIISGHNGSNSWRGFFIRQGNAFLRNLVIQDVTSVGGAGGGGGMGAGAALFIDGSSTAPTTVGISNVTINTATVKGGAGGTTHTSGGGLGIGNLNTDTSNAGVSLTGTAGTGGAGGFGGNGGHGVGGSCAGGGGINCGIDVPGTGTGRGGDSPAGAGNPGGALPAASGGSAAGFGGGTGGANGGGGGAGVAGNPGGNGAGGGIAGGNSSGISGGDGGYGGGGGAGIQSAGGAGGFGGGGGAGSVGNGGSGGFGGGGGCGLASLGGTSLFGGGGGAGGGTAGGVGGGKGASGNNNSGGGAGFGGAIFINQSGVGITSLLIQNAFDTNGLNSATKGTGGGAGASDGFAAGNDIFIRSGAALVLDPFGDTITITNSIADDSAASFLTAPAGVTKGAAAGAPVFIGQSMSSSGTVLYKAANTYSGLTTITKGTLGLFGNGALSPVGNLTINNASIFDISQISAASTTIKDLSGASSAALVNLGGKTLILGSASNSTYAGGMEDGGLGGGAGGSLTKQGSGIFTLSGTNTYSGATTVNVGTLQGGAIDAFSPNSAVTVVSGATLDLNSFSQIIGSLSGSGSVTLGNAILNTGNSGSTTFSGAITGMGGTLTKLGTSRFALTGASNNLGGGGTTNVNEGNLAIVSPGAIVSDTVNILLGATLSGNGTVTGNVTNHGTVSPGNSIDVLNIVGNYTQATGSTLFMEVSPTAADELVVTGTVTIDPGATLSLFFTPGLYPVTNTYTLVHSDVSVTGTFTNTPANTLLIDYAVRYDAMNVFLDILIQPFANVSCGGNIGRVASYLDSLTPIEGSDLGSVVELLDAFNDADSLNNALVQLSPSAYKNLILAQQENVFTVSRGISDHLNTYMNTLCRRGVDRKRRVELWASGFGDWAGMGNRSSKACKADTTYGYHARGTGGLIGVDYSFTNQCVFGATGGYSYSDVHVNNGKVKGHINSVYAAFYTMIRGHGLFLDATLIGGYDRFNASRKMQFSVDTPNVDVASLDRTARTEHGGWNFDAHVDGGFIIDQWRAVEIRPFFAFDCLLVHESAFREHGAESLNLRMQATNNTLLRSELGLNFSHCFIVSHGKWIPQVRGSAVWENFSSNGNHYRAHFVGQPGAFTAKNRNPNRTLFSPGAGVTGVFYEDTLLLSFDYLGEFGQSYHNQVGKIEFSWLF